MMDGEILARGAENRGAKESVRSMQIKEGGAHASTHTRTHARQSNIHVGSHSALKPRIISGGHSFLTSAVTFGQGGMASLIPNYDD